MYVWQSKPGDARMACDAESPVAGKRRVGGISCIRGEIHCDDVTVPPFEFDSSVLGLVICRSVVDAFQVPRINP